jgi:hypothetical protein
VFARSRGFQSSTSVIQILGSSWYDGLICAYVHQVAQSYPKKNMVSDINCRQQFWCVSQFVFTVYGCGDGSCFPIVYCVLLFQSVDRPPGVYAVCRFYRHDSMPHRRHTLCSAEDHTGNRIIISSAQALQLVITPDHVVIVLLSVCYHICLLPSLFISIARR